MASIFCSSVVLACTFNTRVVYNFITKKADIPANLVPFFSGILFLFCRFLKSEVTNELKSIFLLKGKSQGYLFNTGQSFAAHKTLVWSAYIWRRATATFFLKKE